MKLKEQAAANLSFADVCRRLEKVTWTCLSWLLPCCHGGFTHYLPELLLSLFLLTTIQSSLLITQVTREVRQRDLKIDALFPKKLRLTLKVYCIRNGILAS